MPPMDIKEWWIAAAAATSLVATSAGAAPKAGEQVGVVSAVRPSAKSATTDKVVYVGENVAFGERFATDANGVMHILFLDQSSITLGPNTEITINEFAYNPERREGNLAINLLKGALRVVGGFISKKNATRVSTSTATIGIRGGISMIDSQPQQTQAVFLFGQQMQITMGGSSQTITRPGFGISIQGGNLGTPFLAPPSQLQSMTRTFMTPPQTGGGTPPGGAGGSGGQLISTGDRGTGGNQNPALTLAGDRTQNANNTVNTGTPQNSLRNLLGTGASTNQS